MKNFKNTWGRNATRVYVIFHVKEGDIIKKVSEKKVVDLLSTIAFTSPASLAMIVEEGEKQKIKWKNFDQLPEDVRLAISEIKNTPSGINVETIDRLKAIEILLKHLGIKNKDVKKVVIMGEGELEE